MEERELIYTKNAAVQFLRLKSRYEKHEVREYTAREVAG